MKKTISVIIVTYNSERHIFDCLDSLFKHNDIGDELEVIIVDNMSQAFGVTKEKLVERYHDNLIILQNNRNGGYGQGNNVGIRYSTAPIIMIMNPDVRLVQPVFKKAIKVFEDESVVQFGMQQLDKNGNRAYSFAVSSIVHPLIGLPLTSVCNKCRWFIPQLMYLSGACFFVRRKPFEDVGLFDERLFMYREEDDIHYRLMKNKSARIVYDKNTGYLHLHGLYSEPNLDDFSYEQKNLKNDILINKDRGLDAKTVIKRQIIWTKLFIFKERLASIRNKNVKKKIEHMQQWVDQMNQLLKYNNIES